ncbi:hypothetical protein I6N96_03360 [Enterococcus sp. BWM-S5]|uniref:Uncharacterized protein n=1 Tax=Enterococcus larvae TaxID=2794352 RepID=A0ABS4CF83_9ENTE|nr:hypothetical protein [Enterococcus larvae]MBP1045301.1 hypothetical protein [Enterococcus larvae]
MTTKNPKQRDRISKKIRSMDDGGKQFIAGYIAGRLNLKDEKSRSEIIKDAINKKSA